MIPTMSTPVALMVGILLIIIGISFGYKAYLAGIQGKCMYWSGFLPFTLISPFVMHLPAGKNSLVKPAEGLWVHAIMAPLFLVLCILTIAAGADYAGLPGVSSLNIALNGFKWGRADSVVFNRRTGYQFPIIARSGKQLGKIFGAEIGLKEKDKMVQGEPTGSYDSARNNAQGN